MTRVKRRDRRFRIGIALAHDSVTALPLAHTRSVPSASDALSIPLDGGSTTGAEEPCLQALVGAFAAIGEWFGGRRLFVSLLPPLAELRWVELPRLSELEARHILARDAERYFLVGRIPQLVGVSVMERRRRAPDRYLVAHASVTLVEAIYQAADQTGWTIERIVPAVLAWSAFGPTCRFPTATRRFQRDGFVVVRDSRRTDILRVSQGRLCESRRLPTSAPLPSTEVLATVSHENRATTAAGLAAATRRPELIPDEVRARLERRARRAAISLYVAASGVLVATAGAHVWAAREELGDVLARRGQVRGRLREATGVRSAVEGLARRDSAFTSLETGAPAWTSTLALIAAHLPADAQLLAFRGRSDSVLIEGVAGQAADVLDSMRRTPGIGAVRADGPIRRELQGVDRQAVEHFLVAARSQVTHDATNSAPE